MGTCCGRDTDASFEIVYKEGSSEERKHFRIDCQDSLTRDRLLTYIKESAEVMNMPERVKDAIRNERFFINDVNLAKYHHAPRRLRHVDNQIRVNE